MKHWISGLILLFILITSGVAQRAGDYEIFIHTINMPAGDHTFKAVTTENPRWGPDYYLTTGLASKQLTINGNSCGNAIGFANRGTDEPYIGHPVYKIFIDYPNKYAWFIVRTWGCGYGLDLYVTYDWGVDKFYQENGSSDCPNTTNDITGQTIDQYAGGPTCFQPTDPSNLTVISHNGQNVTLQWTPSDQPYVAKSNIYRKINFGNWYLQKEGYLSFFWVDTQIIQGYPIMDTYYYKVYAVSADLSKESVNPTNTVTIQGHGISNKELAATELSWDDFVEVFPNPFNPSTTITYGLPEDSRVELQIYDLMGRQVRTLVSGDRDAGYQSVTWAGQDDSNRSVATGIYIFRITAVSLESDQVYLNSRKIVLLR